MTWMKDHVLKWSMFLKKKADLLCDKHSLPCVFKNSAFGNLFFLHKLVGEGRWRHKKFFIASAKSTKKM